MGEKSQWRYQLAGNREARGWESKKAGKEWEGWRERRGGTTLQAGKNRVQEGVIMGSSRQVHPLSMESSLTSRLQQNPNMRVSEQVNVGR